MPCGHGNCCHARGQYPRSPAPQRCCKAHYKTESMSARQRLDGPYMPKNAAAIMFEVFGIIRVLHRREPHYSIEASGREQVSNCETH